MFTRALRNAFFPVSRILKNQYFPRKYSTNLTGSVLPQKKTPLKRSRPKEFVTLTQNALNRLYQIISDSNKVVYLSLKVKGCNGYVYEMNLVEESSLMDMDERVYDKDGKLVLAIENKASFFLLGSNIDYSEDDLSEGFTFDNPNVTSKCGCGMSFKF